MSAHDRPDPVELLDAVRGFLDAPPDPAAVMRVIDHIGSDETLLFSTDYPHWQFEGTAAIPDGLDPGLARKIMADNPLRTYVRLQET